MTTDRLIHAIMGIVFWVLYLYWNRERYTLIDHLAMLGAVFFGTWVPDWDLWLGIRFHRSPMTHSVLPVVGFVYGIRSISSFILPVGFALGVASHLFWDIIFYGDVRLIPGGAFDRLFLLGNCLALVVYVRLKKRAGAEVKVSTILPQ